MSDGGAYVNPTVRATAGSRACYGANLLGPTNNLHGIYMWLVYGSGAVTPIGGSLNLIPQPDDVFRLSVVGSVLSLYQNGFLILQAEHNHIRKPGHGSSGVLANDEVKKMSCGWTWR